MATKTLLIICGLFIIVMTYCLFTAKQQGLHPDFKAWFIMIPLLMVYVWATGARSKGIK